MNKKLIFVVFSILLMFVGSSAAAGSTLRIENGTSKANDIITVNVTALNVLDLSNFDITLSYDPSIVNVTNADNNPAFSTPLNNLEQASNGIIRLITLNTGSGQSGDVLLSTLTLKAVGTPGQKSNLNLIVNTFVNSTEADIPAGIENGTFSISGNISGVASIEILPASKSLLVGDNFTFTATPKDQNGAPVVATVIWSSSNITVGTVDSSGKFIALNPGTAMVNASNGSVSGSADVTVSKVPITPVLTTITVSTPTANLSIGDTPVFTATALDENNAPMEGINIEWTSSNMTVGNVSPDDAMTDANGKATTTFTAIANGTATVTASNVSVSGSADVTVSEVVVPPVLTKITVSPSNATLSIGNTSVFTATALDQNDIPMKGINITLASSNMTVGNVSPESAMTDANGTAMTTFTAIANGTATVNASNGSIMGSADVTVSEIIVVPPVLTKITVSPPTATLSIGDTPVFTATALDQNGDPMEGINVSWISSNMTVGTVSPENAMTGADGKATTTFTAIAAGTSMVNATNGSVAGSADVVVKEKIEVINLIKNPSFESGRKGWIFYTNGTGRFDIISPGFEGNNASEVTITRRGSNMQLYQKGLTLKPNTHYRLSFAAKSSSGHDVAVVLLKHGSPYTKYGLGKNFNLTMDWQTFTTEFDTKNFNRKVDDGRLMFYLAPFAKAGDKYYFDSVKLDEIQ